MTFLKKSFTQIIVRSMTMTTFLLKPPSPSTSVISRLASTELSQQSIIKKAFITVYFLYAKVVKTNKRRIMNIY